MSRRPMRYRMPFLVFSAAILGGCPAGGPEPPFFNYLDCVKKTAEASRKMGTQRIKAELDARESCRKLYPLKR